MLPTDRITPLGVESLAPRSHTFDVGGTKVAFYELSWEEVCSFETLSNKIDAITYETYVDFITNDENGNAKFSKPDEVVEAKLVEVRRNAMIDAIKPYASFPEGKQFSLEDWKKLPYRVIRSMFRRQVELNARSEALGEVLGLVEAVNARLAETYSTTPTKSEKEPN